MMCYVRDLKYELMNIVYSIKGDARQAQEETFPAFLYGTVVRDSAI